MHEHDTVKMRRITIMGRESRRAIGIDMHPEATLEALVRACAKAFGVTHHLAINEVTRFWVRYVLVDVNAQRFFESLPRSRQRKLYAVIDAGDAIHYADQPQARLVDAGVYDHIRVSLYAVEDEAKSLWRVG